MPLEAGRLLGVNALHLRPCAALRAKKACQSGNKLPPFAQTGGLGNRPFLRFFSKMTDLGCILCRLDRDPSPFGCDLSRLDCDPAPFGCGPGRSFGGPSGQGVKPSRLLRMRQCWWLQVRRIRLQLAVFRQDAFHGSDGRLDLRIHRRERGSLEDDLQRVRSLLRRRWGCRGSLP
jgi:hypothetical protein